jgi:uncharacterized protein (TIGR02284 family)
METMTDLRKETVSGVGKLIRMNRDASDGFNDAAEKVDCPHCRGVFRDAALERKRFGEELVAALRMSEEDIPDGGTALGAFHHAWLKFRGLLSGGDRGAIVSEAIRGESALHDSYEEVLKDTAGSPLNGVLQRQAGAVNATIRNLEDLKSKD